MDATQRYKSLQEQFEAIGTPGWNALNSAEDNAAQTMHEQGQAMRGNEATFAELVIAGYDTITSVQGWQEDYR